MNFDALVHAIADIHRRPQTLPCGQIREAVLKEWIVKEAFTWAADEIFRSVTGK